MRIRAIMDGDVVFWDGTSWTLDESRAAKLSQPEANRRLRITTANNRFLDRDERVEDARIESKP